MENKTEIVGSRRSRVFGPLLMLAALAALGLGIWSVTTQSTALFSNRLVEVSFPILMAWLLWEGGRMLANPRGGMDRIGDRLLLYGESGTDPIPVPLNQIEEIAVHCAREVWGDAVHELWICEAVLKNDVRVILSQSDDEHALKHRAHQICEGLNRNEPTIYDEDTRPTPTAGTEQALGTAPQGVVHGKDKMVLHVGSSGVLSRTLWAGGLVSVVVGTLLLMDVGNNGALGFMFGPFLGVMGIVLLAIPLTKTFLLEHIQWQADGTLTHHNSAFGWHWGQQKHRLEDGWYVRLRQRGLHGGCLEVLSGGRTLVCSGGVHSGTRIQPKDLYWIARFLRSRARSVAVNHPSDDDE